ncbi:unnamed protein product [Gongylonema pulchrum]|uniref:Transmembrane protein 65 n=1 Tax=Gongylonema pulchrum TaxID=637853 RepID=A0A3P7NID4_9BILA|nr:unnamed protein product [Gongylonema pulchrum]
MTQVEEIRIENDDRARSLVATLNADERRRLQTALNELDQRVLSEDPVDKELSRAQSRQLFLVNSIPFIGFGFLDNFIMILAGEYIDRTLGAWLTLSTMAAAALGNTISDVAGVGLTHYVAFVVSKCGIKHPVLNSEQLESSFARIVINVGRAVGLVIGCLIGMFPLLFFGSSDADRMPKESSSKSDS